MPIVLVVDDSPVDRLLVGFNTVKVGDPEDYVLDVIEHILSSGKTGRLEQNISLQAGDILVVPEGAAPTVLVLGVAYKRNVSDVRESPALDIMQALLKRKATVIYNDEYVSSLTLPERTFYSQPLSSGLLQAADCVVIVTDHGYYDIPWIVQEASCIVDTRNTTRGYSDEKIFRL